MKTVPWIAAGAALLLAALVLPAAQPDRKGAEAEIRKIDEQIEREKRAQQKTAAEKERLNRALEEAEGLVSKVSGDLSSLRTQRAALLASRQTLVQERSSRQAQQDAARQDLANQLRAAYFMGGHEPLKLLLNQRSPAQFGRNLTYYGYLGRLRADQVHTIAANIVKIDELTARIDAEDAKLGNVESRLKVRAGELESAQKKRGRVMASLEKESIGRAATLKNLQAEREEKESLLRKLIREAEAKPYDSRSPFAQLRGKLAWPLAGRIVTNFGTRNGVRSDGVQIDAARGSDVRAVHEGWVMFADYMNGLGNVVIVAHGGGYVSIYAHNENLFKAADTKVAAGEKIATVGDTGGSPRPGLYFEIRKGNKPEDPRAWFRSNAPPTG